MIGTAYIIVATFAYMGHSGDLLPFHSSQRVVYVKKADCEAEVVKVAITFKHLSAQHKLPMEPIRIGCVQLSVK